ncbi:NADH-cytochrome b5 reductase [Vararia minispora EC-137]|uniref:NADH-cytochrome b5 reductase n=1 Tax=Vararia minispora EC-137 TaxID=1314806 RepID=A0ACB8QXW5_9AGAM|nr:NADH-cytochrome b5 reductase [Vararia minispora EC-137]
MSVTTHLLFFASFFASLSILIVTSNFIRQKLRDAGYDISRIILYGLPDKPTDTSHSMASDPVAAYLQGLFDGNLPQILAVVFTVASGVVLYYTFGASSKPKRALDPKVWKSFRLKEKIVISPNTAVYRFALHGPKDILGLPIGQHIAISAEINGKEIMRSYTPTSSDEDRGHFDLLVKAYEKGNISRYISLLKIGDSIRVKGPKGQFNYAPGLVNAIGMIAGGTGITPMLQIIRAVCRNPADRTKLSLIYANVNYEDILLKKELDDLVAANPDRLKVYYVLNNPPANWTGGVGFVTKDQIETHLPATDSKIKVLLCGPPPMMTAMKKHLQELKYPAPRTISKLEDQVFLF